jgi:hypothetical protein
LRGCCGSKTNSKTAASTAATSLRGADVSTTTASAAANNHDVNLTAVGNQGRGRAECARRSKFLVFQFATAASSKWRKRRKVAH